MTLFSGGKWHLRLPAYFLFLCALVACGQTGPLYLPDASDEEPKLRDQNEQNLSLTGKPQD